MKVVAIIPSRFESSRFPGKPLADICGKPMIWWVYNRIKRVKDINEIYVATDDDRIMSVCQTYNIPCIMTSNTHRTAVNRLQEVSETIHADWYLQINGDEPLLNIDAVKACIPNVVPTEYEFGMNVITNIEDTAQLMDSSNIKVVFDNDLNALYMSRTPIPYPFKSIDFKYYKHVGVLGYNKKMLDFHRDSSPGTFEIIEGIDSLRMIDYGKKLKFVIVNNIHSLSVDTPKDLEKVKSIINESHDYDDLKKETI